MQEDQIKEIHNKVSYNVVRHWQKSEGMIPAGISHFLKLNFRKWQQFDQKT